MGKEIVRKPLKNQYEQEKYKAKAPSKNTIS